MENNIIKENQLEVLPKNEIATLVKLNSLPVAKDKKELLEIATLRKIKANLEQNVPVRKMGLDEEELDVIKIDGQIYIL